MNQMPLGWNLPAPASKEELLEVLDDIRQSIVDDDSFEGYFIYTMPTVEPWLYPPGTQFGEHGYPIASDGEQFAEPVAPFGLVARYRVGNSVGQGGLSVFTRDWPEGVEQIEQDTERSPWELRRMVRHLRETQELTDPLNEMYARLEIARQALEWALGRTKGLLGLLAHDPFRGEQEQ